jgi:hypothetical protein
MPQGADPPLGAGVRRWRSGGTGGIRALASPKTASTPAVNVACRSRIRNRKPCPPAPHRHHEDASLPGHPFSGRVADDTTNVDPASADLPDDEHEASAQQHGIDREQVTRHHRLRLRDTTHPGRSRSSRRGVKTGRRRMFHTVLCRAPIFLDCVVRRAIRFNPRSRACESRLSHRGS